MNKFRKRKTLLSIIAVVMLLTLALFGLTAAAATKGQDGAQDTVEITDHGNRKVVIPAPDAIKKVYFTSPLGMIYVYTLAPDKLAGTPMKFSEEELKYLQPSCRDLPYLGGYQSDAGLNAEGIIASGAQIIFSIGPDPVSDSNVSSADKLQAQTGIPVVIVDSDIEKADKTYEFLGKILGEEAQAKKLSDYCTRVFKDVVEKVAAVPEKDRVRVYYAEQADGLSTDPENSAHTVVLKYANAVNVAMVEAKGGSGMSKVSMEQVLSWKPDVIISWNADRGGAYEQIKAGEGAWAAVPAVQSGRVYAMPNTPFSWMDRPPSVNRFLGIQWVANLLYPEVYDVDMEEAVMEFYDLFYHVKLTEGEAKELLRDASDTQ